jgi:hypothetical protein
VSSNTIGPMMNTVDEEMMTGVRELQTDIAPPTPGIMVEAPQQGVAAMSDIATDAPTYRRTAEYTYKGKRATSTGATKHSTATSTIDTTSGANENNITKTYNDLCASTASGCNGCVNYNGTFATTTNNHSTASGCDSCVNYNGTVTTTTTNNHFTASGCNSCATKHGTISKISMDAAT